MPKPPEFIRLTIEVERKGLMWIVRVRERQEVEAMDSLAAALLRITQAFASAIHERWKGTIS